MTVAQLKNEHFEDNYSTEIAIDNIENIFNSIKDKIAESISDIKYKTWIGPLKIEVKDDKIIILVKSSMIKSYIEDTYLSTIRKMFVENEVKYKVAVDIKMATTSLKKPVADSDNRNDDNSSSRDIVEERENILWSLGLTKTAFDEKMTFDAFIEDPSNLFAKVAMKQVCSDINTVRYNPVILHAPIGTGKTHLLNALGNTYQKNNKKVLYLTAQKFSEVYIKAVQSQQVAEFKEAFLYFDTIIIEHIQHIIARVKTLETLFNIMKVCIETKRQVIISSTQSPGQILVDSEMKSFLGMGLVADISKHSPELKLQIAQLFCKERNIIIETALLKILVDKIIDIRCLYASIDKIELMQKISSQPIKIHDIEKIILDIQGNQDRVEWNSDKVIEKCSKHYLVRKEHMLSSRRKVEWVRARWVAMGVMKYKLNLSSATIAQIFNCNRTSVCYALNKVDVIISADFGGYDSCLGLLEKL
ncbi:MAG: ATP-binding protein [Alphaproteobacteria bacterium]|nr:ATP-binding protein [Alphaproteobacteria bacterium]MBL0717965.1 ATP-binding protein [Alphaproteobacteria bacterium]